MRDVSLLKLSKGDHTKLNIILKYIELMKDKKWDRITVKELCAAANVTRGTFYQYFDDIYDLMDTIQNFLLEELRQRYRECESETVENPAAQASSIHRNFNEEIPPIFKAWFRFCKDNQEVMLALADEEKGETLFKNKLKKIIVAELDKMMDKDGLPNDALRPHFHSLFFTMHYHSMYLWLSGGADNYISINQMASTLNALRVGATYNFHKEIAKHTDNSNTHSQS